MVNKELKWGAVLGSCKLKHKFGQFSGSIFAALMLTMSGGCSNNAPDSNLLGQVSIFSTKKAFLAATKNDFLSLNEDELKLVLQDEIPALSKKEWLDVFEKVSDIDWEISLNKRAKLIMDNGCDLLRYKWVYYQHADNNSLDYTRHDVYPKEQTLCINQAFRSIRGANTEQSCVIRIHPVNRTGETLSCEMGENGLPKSFALLTDIGENEYPSIPLRCKFRQKIILHYPACKRK